MCLCFASKHPILIIWKGRKGLACAHVYVSGGYEYMGAGKGIALPVSICFAVHINCVTLCVCLFTRSLDAAERGNSSSHIHQTGTGEASGV